MGLYSTSLSFFLAVHSPVLLHPPELDLVLGVSTVVRTVDPLWMEDDLHVVAPRDDLVRVAGWKDMICTAHDRVRVLRVVAHPYTRLDPLQGHHHQGEEATVDRVPHVIEDVGLAMIAIVTVGIVEAELEPEVQAEIDTGLDDR